MKDKAILKFTVILSNVALLSFTAQSGPASFDENYRLHVVSFGDAGFRQISNAWTSDIKEISAGETFSPAAWYLDDDVTPRYSSA